MKKVFDARSYKYLSSHPVVPDELFVNFYNKDGDFFLQNHDGTKYRILTDKEDIRVISNNYTVDWNDKVLLVDCRLKTITIIITDVFMALGKSLEVKDMYYASATHKISVMQESTGKVERLDIFDIDQAGKAYTFRTDKSNYYAF